MAVLNDLLEYQKVDGELRKVEQEIAASEEYKKYMQARKFMKNAQEKLDAQDKRAAELKKLRDDLIVRCEETTKAIEEYADLDELVDGGGDIAFYKKNAQALLDRLRSIKAELNKLIADIGSVSEEYKKFKEQTILMQKQYKEYKEKYEAVKNARAEEVAQINARLKKAGKPLSPEILEKYNAKRKEKIFPILVPLNANMCICGMDFPLAQQNKLAGGNVIECEHCRRFVYKQS